MPYEITKRGDMFEVVDDAGKVAGEHPTRKQAMAQLRALYSNVPEAKEERDEFYDNDVPISGMKEADEITLKNPGHGDQSVHDPHKGGGVGSVDEIDTPVGKVRVGNAVRLRGPVNSGGLVKKISDGKIFVKGSYTGVVSKHDPADVAEIRDVSSKESLVERVISFLKEGRRNATTDQDRLQQIHDLAVANGADCMFSVKEINGAYRWVLLSSNSFQDTDKEIVSAKALADDVARTDKEGGGDYGPLRWWHMGNPDPLLRIPGPGVDIGRCDFRAMQGRTLIESGTFKDKRVATALKNSADTLAASIGFFHPINEPDSEGVYNTIQVFERSVLPRLKASNPLTALTVTNQQGDKDMATMKEKWAEFVTMLGGDEDMARSVVKQAQDTEAQADQAGLKFKETDPPAPSEPKPGEPEPPVVEEKAKAEGKPEPDGDEEKGDEEAAFVKKFMPVIEKKMSEMIASSRKETTEKEAGLEAQITALGTQLKQAQEMIMTLSGDLPRGVRAGFRASLAPETTTTKEAPNQPKPDPLGEMYSWMTNSLANHGPVNP